MSRERIAEIVYPYCTSQPEISLEGVCRRVKSKILLCPTDSSLVDEIERLLAEEREKVREMCAAVAKDFCDESEPGNSVSVKYLEDKYGTLDALQAIRQLDLTKDLAASSREEGKG